MIRREYDTNSVLAAFECIAKVFEQRDQDEVFTGAEVAQVTRTAGVNLVHDQMIEKEEDEDVGC